MNLLYFHLRGLISAALLLALWLVGLHVLFLLLSCFLFLWSRLSGSLPFPSPSPYHREECLFGALPPVKLFSFVGCVFSLDCESCYEVDRHLLLPGARGLHCPESALKPISQPRFSYFKRMVHIWGIVCFCWVLFFKILC